jgi:hypothetical protein
MKIVREDLYPKYWYRDKAAWRKALLERSARKKTELANKLDSNEMLIASLRFYTARLTPEFMEADVLMAGHKLSRKWQRHLKAARLILTVWSRKDHQKCSCFKLDHNWERRVFTRIRLPLMHPAEADQFERLSPNLELDAELQRYSDAHPILEQAKKYLRGWTRSLGAKINELPADTPPPVIKEPSLADSIVWEQEPRPTMNRGKANLRRIFQGNGFA